MNIVTDFALGKKYDLASEEFQQLAVTVQTIIDNIPGRFISKIFHV